LAATNKSPGTFQSFLSRTFAMLLDALNRHRGKGAQKITVEHVHVHVHSSGQTIVGSVSQSGGGDNDENRGQPHAPENAGAITFAPGTTVPRAAKSRRCQDGTIDFVCMDWRSRVLTHREIIPRRPDCQADEPVLGEPDALRLTEHQKAEPGPEGAPLLLARALII
jgi:hypothetical protein